MAKTTKPNMAVDKSYLNEPMTWTRAVVDKKSPFFFTHPTVQTGDLAMLHLKRDHQLPLTIGRTDADGYAEGAVTNTRFGSYPHSTLVGVEWGSQVRASKVDTGTRGRKKQKEQAAQKDDAFGEQDVAKLDKDRKDRAKRKSDEMLPDVSEQPVKKARKQQGAEAVDANNAAPTVAIEAGSGFTHILQPTPEAWTSSLDHRTQVVYTPDYSYIVQRLRVRPGSTIIEAGAGSGSFTHAAARAVFDGTPAGNDEHRRGRVCSYEYHEPRVETLRAELSDHGLNDVVALTHCDVCNEGFLLPSDTSPNADAVFLDLPAPWLALKHLSRESTSSPLNPDNAVHICTFSPCIEQVQMTVREMWKLGWTEIEMVEVQNRRIDVRREHTGLQFEGQRGVNANAASVEESISRLREVEEKLSTFHSNKDIRAVEKAGGLKAGGGGSEEKKIESKASRQVRLKAETESRKLYKEGSLVHRTEPEVKTHTSYLVFAVLPRAWTEEQEMECLRQWPVHEIMKLPTAKADDVQAG